MESQKEVLSLFNSNSFKKLVNYYDTPSILDIVGVSRKEYVHSNFLYWLLDINGTHHLGTLPLRNFLFSCLGQKWRMIGNYELTKNNDYIFPEDWTDILLTHEYKYDIVDFKIDTEYPIKDVGRIDLLLSFKLVVHKEYENKVNNKELDLLLVIENKIDSFEHDKQTNKYYDYFSKCEEFANKKKVYIYLVPDIENKPCNDNFLPFQYQDAINMTISKCLDKPMSERTKEVLISYLRSLSFPSNPNDSIVAITDYEISLVAELWKEHYKGLHELVFNDDKNIKEMYQTYMQTIKNIYYIAIKYDSYFENIKKEDFLEKMKEQTKTASAIYEFKGNKYKRNGGKYSLGRLALAIIKEYVQKEHLDFEGVLERLNTNKICATYHKIELIIEEKNINANKDYEDNGKSLYFIGKDDLIEINKEKYVLYAYWDNSEIQKLIELTKGIVDVREV